MVPICFARAHCRSFEGRKKMNYIEKHHYFLEFSSFSGFSNEPEKCGRCLLVSDIRPKHNCYHEEEKENMSAVSL